MENLYPRPEDVFKMLRKIRSDNPFCPKRIPKWTEKEKKAVSKLYKKFNNQLTKEYKK